MTKPFRLTRPTLNENDIEAACLDLLHIRGYKEERLHSGRFRTMDGKRVITAGEPGIPDYVTVHRQFPGFYLEVKRPGGQPKPHQETKIRELRSGWRLAVAVVDSAMNLRDWLNAHEREAGNRATG